MRFSIIIPTFNEREGLDSLHKSLERVIESSLHQGHSSTEVIVADGGSDDGTSAIASSYGWRTLNARRGRGSQMNAGGAVARGEILIFLHADTHLPPGAGAAIGEALKNGSVIGGNFSLKFAGSSREARWLTRIYPLLRLGGMCYGDSGFFIRRETFTRIGGFRDYPIFEDCDIYRRLRQIGEFRTLPLAATTSSRRFEGRFIRTLLLWMTLQCLYWLGVSPQRLGRLYRARR